MSNKNRVLAEFIGYDYIADEYTVDDLKYHESRDWLHDVWEKFRELRFADNAVFEI